MKNYEGLDSNLDSHYLPLCAFGSIYFLWPNLFTVIVKVGSHLNKIESGSQYIKIISIH